MSRERDPRRVILDDVEPVLSRNKMKVCGPDILIAIYDRAGQKSAGGILYVETYKEDIYQGKTGLVLRLGQHCHDGNKEFMDWFLGEPPKVGDWVGFSVRDAGVSMVIGKTACLTREFKYVRFLVDEPDLVM